MFIGDYYYFVVLRKEGINCYIDCIIFEYYIKIWM